MTGHILIVDDEKNIRKSLRSLLEDESYRVTEAGNGQEALLLFKKSRPDAIILDIWMPGMDGLEVLKNLREEDPSVSVIMISGHGNVETAVKATKLGAYDFIEKPLSVEKILVILKNLFSVRQLTEENLRLRAVVTEKFSMVIGSSKMKHLQTQIDVAAPSYSWVLITGENGTGKELVARQIHEKSDRHDKSFMEINCAAIPDELIESELFGHERGAFTGALSSKKGKFELAHGGTLFLDEVGDMSLKAQAKILRALQEGTFTRVGGSVILEVDCRVIGATNKDLSKEIEAGCFREDLFYRLNVIPLHVPPLRERKEDIRVLANFFLSKMAEESGKRPKTITVDAIKILENYEWPGNVRELKNIVERLFIMTPSEVIEVEHIPPSITQSEVLSSSELEEGDFKKSRMQFERAYIERKLREFDGNVSKTAKSIGMERSHLHRKMRILDIEV